MCGHPEVQDKRRAEVGKVLTDTPSYEELATLPYLDVIIRETLPVVFTNPSDRKSGERGQRDPSLGAADRRERKDA